MKQKHQLNPVYLLLKILAVLFLFWSCEQSIQPRKLEILFLGHQSTHHNSAAFLPLLTTSLTPKGINFTYSDDLADLNLQHLKKFDGLAIYANHDSIAPAQEKALLQFVKEGGAFIPIHSASYCFLNSPKYIELVGAQFQSHKTDTFTTEITNEAHPSMQGLAEFETWDETYVHHLHNENRTVLMERVEGDHREPYTWVREFGKGRVFYTALGHDERTWGHPDFHALLEKGILWAVGEKKQAALAGLTFPTLEYSEAKIPNYEQRDPPPKLQAPLSPEVSQKMIQIPPGFELQLFAAEPDIFKPISMAWDEKGRLWILETRDYPNEINLEKDTGNDQIKILEDTDGDGRADKFTIFADNLSVPTSLTFWNGGVIVSQAPDFLYLKDTDGDDRADERRVIISGWGTFDTHAGPSNLQYGFDNWIWGVLGYSGFKGNIGGEEHDFRQGVYRFKPDGSQLEFMGATSNNTWGLGFSETFDIFASTANNTHSAYLAIPQRYYQDAAGLTGRNIKKIDGHYAFHPVTSNVRQVDVFGGFTAAAGHHLYTARSFPQEYWNRIALVCEPTGHLLHNAILEKDGAGFQEKDGWNLLASADEWVSPVHAEVGPDGAVWILDWYNFIIQHNPTPTGFETGKGNAHLNPLRDKQRGRIYRLAWKKAKQHKAVQLDKNEPQALLEALGNDNMKWRLHAQRLLVERGELDIVSDLLALLNDESIDKIGINGAAIHALWTLKGLGALDGTNEEALLAARNTLSHPSAGVRKAAIQVLPKNEETLQSLIAANNLNDSDPHTRLAAIIALADFTVSDNIGDLLLELSQDEAILTDEHLATAVYLSAVKHKNSFIKALAQSKPEMLKQDNESEESSDKWHLPTYDDTDWGNIEISQSWENAGVEDLEQMDGIVWFRKELELTSTEANTGTTLHLGPIDDSDVTYINGRKVGGLTQKSREPREYQIPRGVLRSGKNVIAVRVEDTGGRGGIYGAADTQFLQTSSKQIQLSGPWKYKIEKVTFSGKSVFGNGKSILGVFLKNYGPYAAQVAATLTEPDVATDQQIIIKTIKNLMKYDLETFSVSAGSTVEILFENNDLMQHNLLIIQPGSLEKVGIAADEMATTPEGVAKGYVPDMPEVLSATTLVDPETTARIIFKVPDTPGDYPFVCTFPGHWRTMNGVMKVVRRAL